jgi:hypothetical protein
MGFTTEPYENTPLADIQLGGLIDSKLVTVPS